MLLRQKNDGALADMSFLGRRSTAFADARAPGNLYCENLNLILNRDPEEARQL